MARLYVSLFSVDRYYGGPEEGGWWYDAGYPLPVTVRGFSRRRKIKRKMVKYVERLQAIANRLNKGKPPISSVASEGQLFVHVTEGYPEPFPKERPHYE